MNDIAISINHISKSYRLFEKPADRLKHTLFWRMGKHYGRDFWALRDVTFTVNRGETVGILGMNGSGKSTLLQIITGTLQSTEGNVVVNGRISALLELGSGFNPEYTGRENIFINGAILGLSHEQVEEKYDQIVEFADIGNFLDQPVKTYSSGMAMRIAFAVAINVDPDILIVDEALAVGDIFFQTKCYRKFKEFQSLGKTILFVTHATDNILKYCNKAIVLDNGKLIAQGEPAALVDTYKKLMVGMLDVKGSAKSNNLNLSDNLNLTDWKNRLILNPNFLEYGDKKLQILDYAIVNGNGEISSQLYDNDEFQVVMKVYIHEVVLDPIFAFTIKDVKGVEITGTNTAYENITLDHISEGNIVVISFKQRLALKHMTYLLSLGCTSYNGDALSVHHRLYDVCALEFYGTQDCVGICNPMSTIDIKLVKE